jgi:SAM-dependent methyltransferase
VTVAPSSTPFRADRLQRIAEIEETHFWFRARRELVERLLARHLAVPGALVLDVGCGTGSLLPVLQASGYRPVGLDLRPEGIARLRTADPTAEVLEGDAERLPFPDGSLDAVLALDVLEHVDDRAALREASRALRPGGLLLVSVPAFPWLWSFRDEDAGHRRRYRRGELENRLVEAGFAPVDIRYFQALLFPLLATSRLLGRRGPRARDAEDRPPALVNRALAAVNRFEVLVGVRWPWGSSLVAVARKP